MVQHVRAARQQYGHDADIRVITFYNMQKRDLEREFKSHPDLSHIRIASASECLGFMFAQKTRTLGSNKIMVRRAQI